MEQFRGHDKQIIEEKVLVNIKAIEKEKMNFHVKFIGCVNTETANAEVLLTSANFTTQRFKAWKGTKTNHDSLSYHKMSKAEFEQKFIDPIKF